ncbi:TPA: hypothetical protein I8W37_002883 [Corynebacterium striatum]|nr:hypothetical protein [Corynebacterium striatum]HAT1174872.1 hypothetical protein [Corynebacterium striatum]HAT1200311.1 hypothetical protein [Corynebacterium striatum]HAT1202868.1 hypothetical protein [Corynebacterium striatum]HAT1205632.1 hypothetical protein [Corynebacterium striatum]
MAITIISSRENYLNRIARREFAPSKSHPIALGVLAESIEHPLIRDLKRPGFSSASFTALC